MDLRRFLSTELDRLPPMSGIYRLYQIINGYWKLVYLGKAINISRRVPQHTEKLFDAVTIKLVHPTRLSSYEKMQLEKMKGSLPQYNKKIG